MLLTAWTSQLPSKRERDLRIMELLNIGSLAICCLQSSRLDDLHGVASHSVSRAHFLVQLLDRSVDGGVSILLVSIVHTSTGLVAYP